MRTEKSVSKEVKRAELKDKIHYHAIISNLINDEADTINNFFDYIETVEKLIKKSHDDETKELISTLRNNDNKCNDKLKDYSFKIQLCLLSNADHFNYLACKNMLHTAKYLNNPIAKVSKKNRLTRNQFQRLKKAMREAKEQEL